jgi:arsenate reductase-like glutaredoxin family protein
VSIETRVDAKKVRYGADEAMALAGSVDEIVSLRGKKVVKVDMRARPGREEVLAALLGPSGNLRAPTVRRGRRLLVGFTPEAYDAFMG